MNTQKKHWSIVLVNDIPLDTEPIYGTEKQAQAFAEIMHPGATIKPFEDVIDLDSIIFKTYPSGVIAEYNGRELFTFEQDEETTEIIIHGEDLPDTRHDVDLFKSFPKFLDLVECDLCGGSGRYVTFEGPETSGTTVCECADVILKP